eukprot:gnl/MRDRNA2_/MRDRNA2_142551_c0_seq1.p1 gnl/MRDRNA2_/MRDRNA2_142551_c0~~gnl/MRDRNA2_/MRDRNA2_142551_c0_seq1.p1  ORF type:complete len:287 (-),score=42.03 gnl/MRDRNA2_/MRDRNA2_142551_c0_seq1:90-950(-)
MSSLDKEAISQECKHQEVDRYNKLSKVGQIASSKCFQKQGLLMTSIMLFWLGVDVDYNQAASLSESHIVFISMHHVFMLYFGVEALLRFCALRHKTDILKCHALTLDILLVLCLVIQVAVASASNMAVLRILRFLGVLQLCRAGRLIRSLNSNTSDKASLSVGCKVVHAMLHCFFVLLLLHYSFAIILVQITRDTAENEKYFATVASGMQSLQDVPGVTDALSGEAVGAFVVYMIFLLLCIVVLLSTFKYIFVEIRTGQIGMQQSTRNNESTFSNIEDQKDVTEKE